MKYFDTLEAAITASNNNNMKLINLLLKNGWIDANNSSPPKNAIEVFSYHYNVECNDTKNCKNVENKGTVYRTDKKAISLRDAHKQLKKIQDGGSDQNINVSKNKPTDLSSDLYYNKYLKYKKKYIDAKYHI
jgi:hypothetical protein